MTTDGTSTATGQYRVTLERAACEGVFACLVRDDRFVEAADGLASIDGAPTDAGDSTVSATFADGRVDEAREAAAACPVDAITVEVLEDA